MSDREEFKVEDLRALCSKCKDGSWVATAYIEQEARIVVFAVHHGKKAKSTIKAALDKAVGRLSDNSEMVSHYDLIEAIGLTVKP